jgi:hypothetical protein
MESSQTTLNLVFTLRATINEAHHDHFTLEGFGARFYCSHPFVPGDTVLLSIKKVPTCPPSPLTQPAPQSNS